MQSVYGVCTGDYDGDGLTDFYATSPVGGNRLYRNLGSFRFRDVTVEAGVSAPDMDSSGATFADVDNDGDLDIYACAYRGENRLFINLGPSPAGVKFVEAARQFGLAFNGASKTMAFADIDNDGDLDGYLATNDVPAPPNVKFAVQYEAGKPVVADALREYWQLIYLPGGRVHRVAAGQFDHLYRNDGDHFTDISQQAGIDGPHITLAATWWDYNDDGRPDLYASNDFLGPDCLYRNDGGGRFTNVASEALPHIPWYSMGADVGDVNNDGLVDLLATDMLARSRPRRMIMGASLDEEPMTQHLQPRQEMRNALFLNTAGPRLLEAARQFNCDKSNWTWNPRLADFDNDGFVDLFITTGMYRDVMNADLSRQAEACCAPGSKALVAFWARQPMLKEPNVALRNQGGRGFEDVGAAWGLDRVGVSYGAVTADFDNDGDLDLVVNNADAPLSIYRNNAGGRSIRVELRGIVSNRYGLGATIICEAGGRRQAQYVTLSRGWISALEPAVHFGLGDAEKVDALTIRWPSGRVQRLVALAAGQTYTITEPATAGDRANVEPLPTSKPLFVAAPPDPAIIHSEEHFGDFEAQLLLPYRLSQPGPALAWADVDGDGDPDAFLGGARGRAERLLLNDGRGNLGAATKNLVESNLQSETAAAALFDADGDEDQDLYVATGSTELPLGDESYRDALYLNDGTGTFARAPDGALPDLRDSGSVVAPADFDQDGDVDLFVGSRSVPGAYPISPENRLLVNDGGKFREAAPEALKHAGMVTDADWADVDGDGWLDLVLTTDWGPVRLFANQRGELVEKTADAGLAGRLGWWLAIAPGDLDADGDVDFVVTNLGRNTPYQATPEAPVEMLYGDVDGLGAMRIIETVVEGGVRYPRRYLRNLLPALPALETAFPTHARYSTARLEEVFDPERLRKCVRFTATELDSGVLWNEGNWQFRFTPLPDAAQLAPASDAAVADLNGDGRLDVVLAQNVRTFNAEVGHLDGSVSLVLLGAGGGQLTPLMPRASGVIVPEQARRVHAIDLDQDARLDLVFGVQGPLVVYRNTGGK